MRRLQLGTQCILAHVENDVAWITFNQPQKRNAVSYEMWQAIPEIIKDFANTDAVRVVVMKGAGDKAFALVEFSIPDFASLQRAPVSSRSKSPSPRPTEAPSLFGMLS